jgi:DNA-binding FrmR family transcriptional regulator
MAAEVSCREAVRLLSAAIDRALSGAETTALERHLAECLYCRNYEVQVKFLHKAAGRFLS